MSRTKKRSKPPGTELWSKRPLSGFTPNKENKKATHRVERAQAKELMKGLDQEESKSQIQREVDSVPLTKKDEE